MMFTTSPSSLFVKALALVAVAQVASALPISQVQSRDVYVPPVTYPKAGTVWKVGSTHNVTWDTSNPPKQITNKLGRVVLAKGGLLDYENPLANGFDILLGRIEVQVPEDTVPGDDYTIVLFGDSGNNSPVFTITN